MTNGLYIVQKEITGRNTYSKIKGIGGKRNEEIMAVIE